MYVNLANVANTKLITITLTNIVGPAANSIFGIASPADQQKWYEAQIDGRLGPGGREQLLKLLRKLTTPRYAMDRALMCANHCPGDNRRKERIWFQ